MLGDIANGVAVVKRFELFGVQARMLGSKREIGDLGPEHIRVVGEHIGGVIDWGDSCVTDPAVDLAWTALGSTAAFAEAVLAAYRPDDDVLARARDWHLLGPWHEVLYGLGEGGPEFVESGLAGTVERLERFGVS